MNSSVDHETLTNVNTNPDISLLVKRECDANPTLQGNVVTASIASLSPRSTTVAAVNNNMTSIPAITTVVASTVASAVANTVASTAAIVVPS